MEKYYSSSRKRRYDISPLTCFDSRWYFLQLCLLYNKWSKNLDPYTSDDF